MNHKTAAVLLAAGLSTRYQGNKLLEVINGKQMYRHMLDIVKNLEIRPKVIVTQYEEIARYAKEENFFVVRNERPEEGISRSIRLGLQRVLDSAPDTESVLFSVCDQPYIKEETVKNLLQLFWEGDKRIASAAYQSICGNPNIFDKKYFPELMRLDGDCGGKKIIRTFENDVAYLFLDNEKELKDVDTKKFD